MKKEAQTVSTLGNDKRKRLTIFFDGAGRRPDGKGSGFAWFSSTTNEKHIERLDGLTSNQAEYHGFISALNSLPKGSSADLYSDSLLICSQFRGEFKVNDPSLADLLNRAKRIISKNRLSVELQWVPRAQNLAGKLI